MPVITTVPYTISAPGSYVLGADLDITNIPYDPSNGLQLGIKIAPGVSGVEIVGDIFSIRHNGGYGSNAVGIYGKQTGDVSIRNITIFGQGMHHGIVIDNTTDPTYEDVSISNANVSSRLIGISVRAKQTTVQDCLCYLGGRDADPVAFPGGISVKALGGASVVKGNRIWWLQNSHGGEVFGIQVANSYGSVIEDNRVENYGQLPKSYGFWINAGEYAMARNKVKNFYYGFGLVEGSSGTIDATTFENVNTQYVPTPWPEGINEWTIT